MFKICKHMKPFIIPLLVTIALLVVQAICELSLPQYTSNIVNVGIQYGGIEEGVPSVITKNDMDNLLLFMNQSDKQEVLSNYNLIQKDKLNKNELKEYSEKYQILKDENFVGDLYELINLDNQEKLTDIFKMPMMIVTSLEKPNDELDKMNQQLKAQLSAQNINTDNLNTLDMLKYLPQEYVDEFASKFEEKLENMPDSILEQSAIQYTKTEYEKVGVDTDKIQNRYMLSTGAKMILLALLSMVVSIVVGFLASRIAAGLGRNLRKGVFKKVVSFSNTEFDHFSTASLITRSTNDVQQIQMLMVMVIRIVFYAPILGIGGVIKVLGTNHEMAWIIGVALGIIMLIVLFLFIVVMPRFKILQKLIDKLNLVTREILIGVPVIRAFGTDKYEEKRFDKANKDLTKTTLFVNRVMTCMMPLMMFVMNGITILIVWNGSHSIESGAMQVGDLMAFIQYTMQIIMSFLMISMISVMLPRAAVSMTRIDEILTSKTAIKDKDNVKSLPENSKGVVEFNNVSFAYPNAEESVLSNISFKANCGETTAIIGATGCGKSTLVNLIPRFYDVTQGSITIDNVDIRDLSQHDLRKKIGYVPQKGVLFSGTIESNLKYGDTNISDEDMQKAIEISQSKEFIDQKEYGVQSEISQGGKNVSGGQKQRLSIARAIAKKPSIYIFDDSFSALDYKTDLTLRNALKENTENSTVIIVAQRISTILHAEQIIVLDEGKIVGKGTHSELLKSCEVYKQIALSQLSQEELGDE